LQLDVIERCIALWSNPGEIVLTPFMGVGSEVFCAVRNGRRAIGIELKPSYYRQSIKNMEQCESKDNQVDIFHGDTCGHDLDQNGVEVVEASKGERMFAIFEGEK
jgi:tRNA G10  N-methylase Trm11